MSTVTESTSVRRLVCGAPYVLHTMTSDDPDCPLFYRMDADAAASLCFTATDHPNHPDLLVVAVACASCAKAMAKAPRAADVVQPWYPGAKVRPS